MIDATGTTRQDQYRKIAKNTVILGSAQIVQMLVTLVRAKVIAVLLGPFGAGVNSLILSALSVMQQVSSAGIYQSGVREMSVIAGTVAPEQGLAKFRKLFLRLSFLCGMAGVVVMALLSPLFSYLLFDNYQYTIWLAIVSFALFFMALQNGYGVMMQATCNLGLLARATIVGAIGGLLAAIGLFYFWGLYGIVPAIVAGYVAFALAYRHFEHKIVFPKVETYAKEEFFNQSKPILKLGIVLMLSAIAGTLFAFALNLVINRLGSTEEVGLYQSAASIVTQGMSITNVVLASDFFSRLSAVHTDTFRMQNLIRQQVDILLYTIAPISVLLIVFAPFIVWLLLSPQFILVTGLLQIMSMALVFKVMWITMSYIILAKGDKKSYFLFDALLGNGINFLLSVAGFYFFGLDGLAWSYLAGSLLMVALLWGVTKKRCGATLSGMDLLKMTGLACYLLLTYLLAMFAKGTVYYVTMGVASVAIIVYSAAQLDKRIKIWELIKNKLMK